MAIQWGLLKPYDVNQSLDQFSKGFLTPFVAGNEMQQAKMRQMQVQKAQRQQTALNEYKQTGDVQALLRADPEMGQMAAKADEYIRTRPPDEMVKLAKATQYMQMARPYLNAQTWPTIRKQMQQIGAPDNMMPPENASPEQLQQFAWGSDIMHASVQNMGKSLKGGEYVRTPTGLQQVPLTEEQKAKARKEGAQADFYEQKAKDPYYGKTPEYIKPVGKEGPIQPHTPGQPVPDGFEFTSSHGRSLSRTMTDENKEALVQGMVEGDIPPSMLSKRAGDYNDVVATAKRQGVNLTKLQTEYEGAKRFAGSLNSQQMVRYRGLAGSVVGTINEVKQLSEQMELSGMRPVNYLELQTLTKTAGNTPQGQLATKYVTAVNTLKEEFANLAQGGYAPTESVWHLANKQINENFGVKQMGASLEEIKRLVQYRTHAFEELGPMKPGGSKESEGKPSGDVEAAKQRYETSKRAWDAEPDSPEKEEALRTLEASRKKYGF